MPEPSLWSHEKFEENFAEAGRIAGFDLDEASSVKAAAKITAPLLPHPLEQAEVPGGLIFIAEYPRTNLGTGYRESALFIRCRYRGEAGSYCLSMPITNEARMHNGHDTRRMGNRLFEAQLAALEEGRHLGQRFSEHIEAFAGGLTFDPAFGVLHSNEGVCDI